jgi:hypothetical protein
MTPKFNIYESKIQLRLIYEVEIYKIKNFPKLKISQN